jgi:UDP-N-acetyl-D-mannosaminuronic acid dehydrogenase
MLLPGAGVGGHCIPKDSWLLASAVMPALPLQLIPAARNVNDAMPFHVADLLIRALKHAGAMRPDTCVAILGYAYLENSDDTRNSPSAVLAARLDAMAIDYVIHDPWVHPYQGPLFDVVSGCDAAVVMVRHQEYCQLDLPQLRVALKTPIIVDGRHVFDAATAEAAGFVYAGVGSGKRSHNHTVPKEPQL